MNSLGREAAGLRWVGRSCAARHRFALTPCRFSVASACSSFSQRRFCSSSLFPTVPELPPRAALVEPKRNKQMLHYYQEFLERERHDDVLKSIPLNKPTDVFVNQEIRLGDIKVIGFDYDYTLANYSSQVEPLIYRLALDRLIDKYGYPSELHTKEYDHTFAVRGLHYDVSKGHLLKLDSFYRVYSCVHGRRALSAEEISEAYPNNRINEDHPTLRFISDIFSNAEVCLLADVIQYFVDNGISFNAFAIHEDIASAINLAHERGILHKEILYDLPKYLGKSPNVAALLQGLREKMGKKLFLLTNSSYHFVDAGMRHMLSSSSSSWESLFDVIITDAQKPLFYSQARPFRKVDRGTGRFTWKQVQELKTGEVYVHGSLNELEKLTGWSGNSILFFGDHLDADIVAPNLTGWRTGFIVAALEKEIEIQNSVRYRKILTHLLDLEKLLRDCSEFGDEEETIEQWTKHRDVYKHALKHLFNDYFGSVFKTYHNNSFFAYTIRRHADIYTSRLENLLKVPLHDRYVFYPHRALLPHEPRIAPPPNSTTNIV
ncbi:5'-nucleotidase domain-containing protein [Balamuthia mandrillaris]